MTMTEGRGPAAVYGLQQPGAAEARSSLERIYGPEADAKWRDLLHDAGLDGGLGILDADAEFTRIVDAFLRSGDQIVGLCGQALKIRQETYRHLSSASDHIGGSK